MLAGPRAAEALDEIANAADATRPSEGSNLFSPRSAAAITLSTISIQQQGATAPLQTLFEAQNESAPLELNVSPQEEASHKQAFNPPRENIAQQMEQKILQAEKRQLIPVSKPSIERNDSDFSGMHNMPEHHPAPYSVSEQYPIWQQPNATPGAILASGSFPLPPHNAMIAYPSSHNDQGFMAQRFVTRGKAMPTSDFLPPWTPPTWTSEQRPSHRVVPALFPSYRHTTYEAPPHHPQHYHPAMPHPGMHFYHSNHHHHHTVAPPSAPQSTPHGMGMTVTPTPHKKQKIEHGYVPPQFQSSNPPPESSSSATTTSTSAYDRKRKSLGMLAESFLYKFTTQPGDDRHISEQPCEIVIDQVADELDVERRRVYDVVNILESLRLVVKKGKNTYQWMGREHLTRQFALLQNEAIEQWPDVAREHGLLNDDGAERAQHATEQQKDPILPFGPGRPKKDGNKSLTRLSEMFLQVFLVGFLTTNLPQASELIHGGPSTLEELANLGCKGENNVLPTDPKLFQQAAARGLKTKIRRLYDIANVFLSVGLLRKTENRSAATVEGKRPHFHWNYNLDIRQIREIYKTMPNRMRNDKTPFNDAQIAVLEEVGLNNNRYVGALTEAVDAPVLLLRDTSASTSSSSTPTTLLPPNYDCNNNDCDSSKNGEKTSFLRNIHQTGGAVFDKGNNERRVSLPEN